MTPSFAETALANLKGQYDQTKNPVYVWRAIAVCGGDLTGEPSPYPAWCVEYLTRTSQNITWLAQRRDSRTKDPSHVDRGRVAAISFAEALKRLPNALGLSKKGWNAFGAAFADETARVLAVEAHPIRAEAVLKRLSTSTKAVSERQVRRNLARGKRHAALPPKPVKAPR